LEYFTHTQEEKGRKKRGKGDEKDPTAYPNTDEQAIAKVIIAANQ